MNPDTLPCTNPQCNGELNPIRERYYNNPLIEQIIIEYYCNHCGKHAIDTHNLP